MFGLSTVKSGQVPICSTQTKRDKNFLCQKIHNCRHGLKIFLFGSNFKAPELVN